jgi:hypothetical protein
MGGINTVTSDTAPFTNIAMGNNAWSGSTVSISGSNLVLAGGIGRNYFTILSGSLLSGSTVTITVNGTATTLIGSGSNSFAVSSSNYYTALSMSSVINTISGVSSSFSASLTTPTLRGYVFVTPNVGTYALTLATNATATTASVVSGNRGNVIVNSNSWSVDASGNITGSNLLATSYTTTGVSPVIITAAGIIRSGAALYFGSSNSPHLAGSGYIALGLVGGAATVGGNKSYMTFNDNNMSYLLSGSAVNITGSVNVNGNISASVVTASVFNNSGYNIPIMQAGSSSVSAGTSAIVIFNKAMPNVNYVVSLTGESTITGLYASGKTVGGFTASFSIYSGNFDWIVVGATQ